MKMRGGDMDTGKRTLRNEGKKLKDAEQPKPSGPTLSQTNKHAKNDN
jgi:hypothetical protein